MLSQSDKRLIVGLGNPGKAYERTRHNAGFMVVRSFAEKRGWKFHSHAGFGAELADGVWEGMRLLLLLPITYMNTSGEAVEQCKNYFRIELSDMLVVSDDVDTEFGKLRFREKGSSGGHKGLKSIEAHLGSQEFARIKVGIGDREEGSLSDYVLGRFTEEEEKILPQIIDQAVLMLEGWLQRK